MSKKTKKPPAKLALRRLIEDEEVQTNLRTAAVRVREAWGRASGRSSSKAVEDKKIYDKVREAATSLTKAANRLSRPPEPPKHHGRNAALVAVGAGGAAYALKKRRGRSTANGAAATAPAGAEVKEGETTLGVTG